MASWGVWSRDGHVRGDAVMVVSWGFNQCSCLGVTTLLLQPLDESSCTTNKTYQIPLFSPFSVSSLFAATCEPRRRRSVQDLSAIGTESSQVRCFNFTLSVVRSIRNWEEFRCNKQYSQLHFILPSNKYVK